MWWLPAATDARQGLLPGSLLPTGATGDVATAAAAAPELLQLAAAQRMNTDVRRAVFVAIMGSEDCLDAFEKLLRLPLKVRLVLS
jgi:nucleolar MIF4G domain-containing protein 1